MTYFVLVIRNKRLVYEPCSRAEYLARQSATPDALKGDAK